MGRNVAGGMLAAIIAIFVGCAPSVAQEKGKAEGGEPKKVVKTDQEWQKLLTREQYLVTRQKATEPAGTGKYANYHGKGVFACVCCGTELFDARNKFESGTGWPSFDRPISGKNVATEEDFSLGEARTEVTCSVCDAHLGHVFGDGPPTTGMRFCINSAALKLVKAPVAEAKSKSAGKGKAEAKKKEAVKKTDAKGDEKP